jgi:probable rRNA maturation factor
VTADFTIVHTTRSAPPRLPYADMKKRIVGPHYAVSLVFVGKARAQAQNRAWRRKEYIPNVLACEVTKRMGEIFICPHVAKHEAHTYGHSYSEHIGYLFIHALLHLKGFAHGDTMEKAENRFMKKYNLA